jgi:hypothetical protein
LSLPVNGAFPAVYLAASGLHPRRGFVLSLHGGGLSNLKPHCNAGTPQGVRRADLLLFAVFGFEPGDPEYRKAGVVGRSDDRAGLFSQRAVRKLLR